MQKERMTDTQHLIRPDGETLAFKRVAGDGATVVWIGGFRSDMEGTKALALDAAARQGGWNYVRYDHFAHGVSSGDWRQATIGRWRQDAIALIDALNGPVIPVGSSMGGWIALLLALARPERMAGLVLVNPAQDFTQRLMWPTLPDHVRQTILRDGVTATTLTGSAARDADPADGSFPLVILSHGYPGNRYLMSHLAENLASKGYVVVAADHPESTYDDQQAFASTLVNRAVDQRFLLDSMAGLEDEIGAITDADRTAIIGYSMGGYGALIFGGAGLSRTVLERTEPAAFVPPCS